MQILAEAGESIYRAAERAVGLVRQRGSDYDFLMFNGIRIDVGYHSDPDDLATIYNLKLRLSRYEK